MTSQPSSFFSELSQVLQILNFLKTGQLKTFHISSLYEQFPFFPKPSIRRVLYSLIKNKVLDIKRIRRGYYEIGKIGEYETYLYTLRVFDTFMPQVRNRWLGVEAEASIEGTVFNTLSHEDIESVLKPKLIDAFMELLSTLGVFLIADAIDLDIQGAEWRGITHKKYNPFFNVEVIFTNTIYGRQYPAAKKIIIKKAEWDFDR